MLYNFCFSSLDLKYVKHLRRPRILNLEKQYIYKEIYFLCDRQSWKTETEAVLAPGRVFLLVCLGQRLTWWPSVVCVCVCSLNCDSVVPPPPALEKVTSLKFSCRHLNCAVVMGCPKLSATPKRTHTKATEPTSEKSPKISKAPQRRLFSVGNAYRAGEIKKGLKLPNDSKRTLLSTISLTTPTPIADQCR